MYEYRVEVTKISNKSGFDSWRLTVVMLVLLVFHQQHYVFSFLFDMKL